MPDLQPFGENIWTTDGPPVRFAGFTLPTRMVVVKLVDDSLWVNSPVSVPSDVLNQMTALGPVRNLVAPTKLHVWRLEKWHTLFPNAALWMPPQVPNQFKHLPSAGILRDEPPSDWAGELDQMVFKGNFFIQEVEFFHKTSQTLVMADFIQNHPLTGRFFQDTLLRAAGVAHPRGGVPLDVRLSFTNRNHARRSLEKLLSWNFNKVIIAHGVCIERDARSFIEKAFRWLFD